MKTKKQSVRRSDVYKELNGTGSFVQKPLTTKEFNMPKTYYFCFGDYRSGKKKYRIIKVQNREDAYKVAKETGFRISKRDKEEYLSYPEKNVVNGILLFIHIALHGIENVVSCVREEYEEALRMQKHFTESDMSLYFPKFASDPANSDSSPDTELKFARIMNPWILEYYEKKYRESQAQGQPRFVIWPVNGFRPKRPKP